MSALPGLGTTLVRGRRWQKSRSPGKARRKPLKPLRAGMPGDSGVLVVTRVRSTTKSAHEAAGALGTRRSPRPLWAEDPSTARAHRAARCLDSSSLRANGSRECAPDNRLREAIHLSLRGEMDCFVASLL